MIDVERALKVPGFTHRPALEWLAEQASEHKVIVEIGSYCGRSTRAMADNTEGIIYAIDDWKGVRKDFWGKPLAPDLQEQGRNSSGIFAANLEDLLLTTKVVAITANHGAIDTFPFFANFGLPDMVFIDGDHDYENVHRDISIWMKKLAPGGLLCGDDYSWPGVKQAVSELVPNAVAVEGTELWYRP